MTIRKLRSVTVLAALLLLAGCAAYQLVSPGPVTVRNTMVVEPGRAWSRVNFQNAPGPIEMWTLNGPAIDSITFFMPVADGEPLRRKEPGNNEPFPPFRASMTPSEIAELYEATLRRSASSALVEVKNLRPATFGGNEGFRADTVYVTQDRVRRKGVLAGTVKNQRLYLIHFQAPELNYYDLGVGEVEKILASARIL